MIKKHLVLLAATASFAAIGLLGTVVICNAVTGNPIVGKLTPAFLLNK